MKVDFGTMYFAVMAAVIITYTLTKFGIRGMFDANIKPVKWLKKLRMSFFE